MTTKLTLFSYFRSSASYRVRIALHYKGLQADYRAIHLLEGGGQQHSEVYRQYNPMAELPTLLVEREGEEPFALAQSVAILEYLEESYPEPPLLPKTPEARARVRQVVECVNSSIQPIQNLKVMQYLQAHLGATSQQTQAWAAHWIERGFRGLEALLSRYAGRHAVGDAITLADVLLVPQHYNALRFGVEMTAFPTLSRVCRAAEALPAFQQAAPDQQPDTPKSP